MSLWGLRAFISHALDAKQVTPVTPAGDRAEKPTGAGDWIVAHYGFPRWELLGDNAPSNAARTVALCILSYHMNQAMQHTFRRMLKLRNDLVKE